MASSKPFGLIGGLGPPSTVFYYNAVLQAHATHGAPARLFIAHADLARSVGLVQSDDRAGLAEYLVSLIRPLAATGAEFVGIAAMTAHLCSRELAAITPVPVVDMVDVLIGRLQARGAKRVAFLGNRFTMGSNVFGRLAAFDLIELSAAVRNDVDRIYSSIVRNGYAADNDVETLKALCNRLYREEGADTVISGGTEFSLVLREGEVDAPLVDCAREHVAALTERAIG